MKITYIKFKVTTCKKWKCNKCKKILQGNDGFIHIKCGKDYGYYGDLDHIRICWDCVENLSKEWREDRKNRKSKYLKLTKWAIVRNLEK